MRKSCPLCTLRTARLQFPFICFVSISYFFLVPLSFFVSPSSFFPLVTSLHHSFLFPFYNSFIISFFVFDSALPLISSCLPSFYLSGLIYFISCLPFAPNFVLSCFTIFRLSCLGLVPFLSSIIYSSLYLPLSFSVYMPLLYLSPFHSCVSISLRFCPLKYSICILLTVRI
jgi:hypothetical protein